MSSLRAGWLAAVAMAIACSSSSLGVATAQAVTYFPDAGEAAPYAEERGIPLDEAQRRLSWQRQAADLLDTAPKALGDSFGGVWIDPKDGDRVKLGVAGDLDARQEAARDAVEQAGLQDAADVVSVPHSQAHLDEISAWLQGEFQDANAFASKPLTSGVRTDESYVELQRPRGVALTSAQQALIDEADERYGDALHVGSYDGTPRDMTCAYPYCDPPLRAGIAISNNGGCTGGFIGRGRGPANRLFQFTAGHCGPPQSGYWWTRHTSGWLHDIGPLYNAVNGPSGDAGILRVVDPPSWNARSWVYISGGPETTFNPHYRIRSDAPSAINMRVCTTGGAYGHSDCGRVTQLNASLLGTNGLVRTNICATVGDSGAPTYAVNTAFGLMKGQWSECDTLYEPIRRAENLMNVDVTHALD